MSKQSLVVIMECEPAAREELMRSLLAHRERCLKDEPGTLQFEVMVPAEDPAKLVVFELYTDSAALAVHSGNPSIAQFRAEAGALIIGATRYTCALGQELST